ncbi:MAG: hypothetical protein N3B10_04295 [Armatimonadetes bacterium]|nr:hypothetical protein [Armatimonadota bacterium]
MERYRLYEIRWELATDVGEFHFSEVKVFASEKESRRYGRARQRELNNGLSISEKAQDGYYFKFRGAEPLDEIDGFSVILVSSGQPQEKDGGEFIE